MYEIGKGWKGKREERKGGGIPRGARRASSSAFQYFLSWASEMLEADASRGLREVDKVVLAFFLRGVGSGARIGTEISSCACSCGSSVGEETVSGSGVGTVVSSTISACPGSESFD